MKHAATHEALSERGVVTYVGLMFAMLIAASAWSTLGTGDAILAKLKSQELADASVYSSAVTNAQGMNFVATLNVAMLALTGTYVAGQKVVNVLDTAINVNPNTENNLGGAADGLFDGPADNSGWRPVKNWGRADPGVSAVNLACAKEPNKCRADDIRATCAKQEQAKVMGDRRDYCDVAGAIRKAHDAMAGGGPGDAMGKMGLEGFKAIVVAKSFPELAKMQHTIASTQGSLGDYLGSMMKKQVATPAGQSGILDGETTAHVVSVCTKGGGNYKATKALQNSESLGADNNAGHQLPVTPHPAADLCLYVGIKEGTTFRDDEVGKRATVSSGQDATRGGAILGIGTRRDTNCGVADVWKLSPTVAFNGPMLIAGGPAPAAPGAERGLQNGGVGFQSVSMITSKMPEERGQLAVRPFGWFSSLGNRGDWQPAPPPANAAGTYRAQGEFYLDCARGISSGRWDDTLCNGQNLAMMRLQWRARLTPIRTSSSALTASGLGASGTPGIAPEGAPSVDGKFVVDKLKPDLPQPPPVVATTPPPG